MIAPSRVPAAATRTRRRAAAPPAPTAATLPARRAPGASAREQADRILAGLVHGTGPVLLCVPGTSGAAFESSMLATARAFLAEMAGRPSSVVSVPYSNSAANAVGRFFGLGTSRGQSVLALVIAGLRRLAPHRPILVAGESQGAWVIAHDLQDPALAAAVTRVVLFAKPGFQRLPAGIGQAAAGADMLPGARGLVEVRHVDDIVPSLFSRLGLPVLRSYVTAFRDWARTGEYEYPPHHYDSHGAEAAAWLARGVPLPRPVHDSRDDRA